MANPLSRNSCRTIILNGNQLTLQAFLAPEDDAQFVMLLFNLNGNDWIAVHYGGAAAVPYQNLTLDEIVDPLYRLVRQHVDMFPAATHDNYYLFLRWLVSQISINLAHVIKMQMQEQQGKMEVKPSGVPLCLVFLPGIC